LSAPKVKIRFESFTKCFGDLLVLDNIDATLYENEFICIVGPTGCGKTTLANVVCGLLPPTKGKVTIDGAEVDPRKHNIAFVFQEVAILPWKTVEDNIKLGLELKNFPKGVIKARVHEMISQSNFGRDETESGYRKGFLCRYGPAVHG
jgi:ABC-type sugar transport system ATPase subunit